MASHHIKLLPNPLPICASLTVNFCQDRLIFFGGFDGNVCLSSLQVFDLKENQWLSLTELSSAQRPSARHQHCAEFLEPNSLLIFGGANGPEFFNDTFLLNTSTFAWEQINTKGARVPEARYGASMCKASSDSVYMLAGYGGSYSELSTTPEEGLDDFWVFEASKRAWRTLATFGEEKPKGTGWHSFVHLGLVWAVGELPNKFLALDLQSREWKERTAVGTYPERLTRYSLTLLETGVVVVFGGVIVHLDISEEEVIWHKLDVTGNLPTPRHSHATCSLGESLLIVGGSSARQYLNDICVINPSLELRWLCLRVVGTPPKPRVLHTACAAPELKSMILIGGDVHSKASAEVHLFDYMKWEWKEIKTEGHFPPVCGHTAVYLPEEESVLVYGGGDLKECYSTLYLLHLPTFTWKQKLIKRKIPPRVGHCSLLLPNNHEIAVIGGFVPLEGYKNEIWILNLQSYSWTQVPVRTNEVAFPVGRVGMTCTLAKNKSGEDVFWMIGGINQTVPLNDIWVMNLQTLTWERVSPSGRGPGPLYGHSTSLINSTLFVYAPRCLDASGAVVRVPKSGEIWSLHILATPPYWSKYKVAGNIPPRIFHSAVVVTNDIVFFGGCADSNVYQLDRNDIGDTAVSDNMYRDFILPFKALPAAWLLPPEEGKVASPAKSRKHSKGKKKKGATPRSNTSSSPLSPEEEEDEDDLYRKPEIPEEGEDTDLSFT